MEGALLTHPTVPDVSDEELLEVAALHVARYKMPKAIVRVPQVACSPAGKADYRWARAVAADP